MSEEKETESKNSNEFKPILDQNEINQIRNNLVQIKTFLEQKLEKEINNFVQTKEDFHRLLHLERINKMSKQENNNEL